ncbi:MAG: tetratricopeptide repeat protein [Acidobacteria bacterium]|nr:tetratricopeptide repeat protein [Acidobacteriota bacterium]
MTRKAAILFLLLGLLAGAPVGAADRAVQLLLDKAQALEGRGRLDMAAEAWRQVLLADPDQPDALAGLAKAARLDGRNAEAEQYLSRLRQVAPGHPALQSITDVKALGPYQAQLDEASRLSKEGKKEEAMRIYRDVFGEAPPAGGWAIAYYETLAATADGWKPAVDGLRKLSAKYPEADEYRLSLGRLLTYRPETRTEGMQMLAAIGEGPDAAPARQAWRQALVWAGPNRESLDSLNAYLSRYDDSELAALRDSVPAAGQARSAPTAGREIELGYKALREKDLEEAERQFRAALETAPSNAKALAGMGFVRMQQERFRAAVESLTAASQAAPGDEVILDALATARFWTSMDDGKTALEEGRTADSVAAYQTALSMRPSEADALRGLAGGLMKLGKPAEAAPVYEKLLGVEPLNDQAWADLVNARYEADGAVAALAASRDMPPAARERLDQNVSHLALMAVIYADTGREEHSRETLQRAMQLAAPNSVDLPEPIRLRLAGLQLRHGDAARAAKEFEDVLQADPSNLDAWEGALAGFVQAGDLAHARVLLSSTPDDVYYRAMQRPSFLYAAAKLHQAVGQLDTAEGFLRKALEAQPDPKSKEALGIRLELAYLLRDSGETDAAERQIRSLVDANPESADAHKALIGLLASAGRYEEASAAFAKLPLAVSSRLLNDPDFITILAGIYKETGRSEEALRMVREALATLAIEKKEPSPALRLQQAWLLLDQGGEDQKLFELLQAAREDPNLSTAQRKEFGEIWLIWSLREADRSREAGNVQRSASILVAAARMFPEDDRVRRALAGTLLEAGYAGQALVVYKSWGLRGAEAADYAGAIGAAMTVQDRAATNQWLREGLQKWPQDADLLTMAGRVAASRGDYKRAEAYWKAALQNMPTQNPAPGFPFDAQMGGPQGAGQQDPAGDLGRLLLADAGGSSSSLSDMSWLSPVGQAARQTPSPGGFAPSAQQAGPLPLFDEAPETRTVASAQRPMTAPRPAPPSARTQGWDNFELPDMEALDNQMAALVQQERPRSRRSEIEDQIAAIEARNTPTAGMGGSTRGRSGRTGFESLRVQEADFRASAVVGNRVRFSMSARPTYLDAGSWDGQSDLRLGLLPAGSQFGDLTANGVAGDLEIGTKTFGLRFGTTPSGFLVENLTYGFRFTPGGGPFTASFNRAPVTDTMLSFAGLRDPVTGQVWGGVMADEFALRGDWGGAKRGAYAKAGYQKLTGDGVADNKRIEVTAGTYFEALRTDEGALTLGFNLTGLSYDKNLRYFTLGQGGYFSPQRYMLLNVPVHWRGSWQRRFHYDIGGSIGTQYVREDASPYFPTSIALQGRSGPQYAALSRTGAHFSLDARGAYHLAPNWVIGAFVTANNTRNFTAGSAGFFLNYLVKPRPIGQETDIPPVPDWTGQRPYFLP